ncbi:MAG: hypothetical protein II995_02780, partial [Oscillospiraceae bacterium]|nr:hypothetical protein [Oscillospiraceae bacterium]
MKKFFALVLAVAMIMSLASVAMAATNEVVLAGPYDYDADSNKMTKATGVYVERADKSVKSTILTYGDTVYYLLTIDGDYVSDYALVEKLKVKVAYEMGEENVESVSVVKKYVDWTKYDTSKWEDGYYYFVAFKTKSAATTADADVVGTLEFNRKELKKDDAVVGAFNGEIEDEEIDFAFNLFYERSWLTGAKQDMYVKGDKAALKWDT